MPTRRRWHLLKVPFFVFLAAIALAFVGSPTVLAADETPAGATDAAVSAIAEEFGVSPQVALSRLEFQVRFGEVVNHIAAEVPSYVDSALSDDFAENAGTVLLADATEVEWQTAKALIAPLGDAVELKQARLTAADEQTMFDTALLLIDTPTDGRGIYTPMTRGREANHAYVSVESNRAAIDVLTRAITRDWTDEPAVERRTQLNQPQPGVTEAVGDDARRAAIEEQIRKATESRGFRRPMGRSVSR